MEQLPEEKLFWQPHPESNSIAIIVKHLSGNMLSRFTDFLSSDGEKEWRDRDSEFENDIPTREKLMQSWQKGWDCVLDSLESLTGTNLEQTVYIRREPHTVIDALHRQIAHYAYHVGQIVFIAKMAAGSSWTSLTIPKNASKAYNESKFRTGEEPTNP